MQPRRKPCLHSQLCICRNGPLNDEVIELVFKAANWNPFLLCSAACACRWFADLAKRVLWKEFCLSRGPKMVADLAAGCQHGTIDGGWDSLGKLLFYCAGCHDNRNVQFKAVSGHFVWKTRFSKTSGKSFLVPQCRTDILYLSDPCEHLDEQHGEEDIGLFRGVFRAFGTSKTRKMLVDQDVQLEQNETCPYCWAKSWSMLQANMIPRSASRRLGAYDDDVEYFVCLHGHLYGTCPRMQVQAKKQVQDSRHDVKHVQWHEYITMGCSHLDHKL